MSCADYVVVVCRSGVTTSDGAQRTRELLSRIAAPVSGVVLLGSSASPNDYYYYYSRSQAQRIATESRRSDDATGADAHDLATSGTNGHGPSRNGDSAAPEEPSRERPIGTEPRPSP
jgi:hypothetical protein